MSSRVRKQSEGLSQKMGPMKATLPMSSLLRGTLHCGSTGNNFGNTLSPQMRHISPEHTISGHRSPGALSYKGKSIGRSESCMRRTASLDALYMRPSWNVVPPCTTLLQLDKATQTDESLLMDRAKGSSDFLRCDTPTDAKIEKVFRQRLPRSQRSGAENSVSSQTLSPIHAKASPVTIPPRTCPPMHMRPMRNSVEGLNQEIEKLVLFPGQPHTCRPESNLNMFSRGTPEGHRAPVADLLHGDTRSVNTQTPIGDHLSSDDSQSTSPEEGGGSSFTGASPRINKFLAREPPDGCEKVNLKLTEADQFTTTVFKPCVGFQLRPSLGSAFQPLQPIAMKTINKSPEIQTEDNQCTAADDNDVIDDEQQQLQNNETIIN